MEETGLSTANYVLSLCILFLKVGFGLVGRPPVERALVQCLTDSSKVFVCNWLYEVKY
jgi:hypothetical protein